MGWATISKGYKIQGLLGRIERLKKKLAKTTDPERTAKMNAELKRLLKIVRFSSRSVPMPHSYVEARKKQIQEAHRISKFPSARFVQGGAPGTGRKK